MAEKLSAIFFTRGNHLCRDELRLYTNKNKTNT
jgi:hypothetical protein